MTDPKHPRYLHRVRGIWRYGEAGGAQMVRLRGKSCKGDPAKTYLLRTVGNQAREF